LLSVFEIKDYFSFLIIATVYHCLLSSCAREAKYKWDTKNARFLTNTSLYLGNDIGKGYSY